MCAGAPVQATPWHSGAPEHGRCRGVEKTRESRFRVRAQAPSACLWVQHTSLNLQGTAPAPIAPTAQSQSAPIAAAALITVTTSTAATLRSPSQPQATGSITVTFAEPFLMTLTAYHSPTLGPSSVRDNMHCALEEWTQQAVPGTHELQPFVDGRAPRIPSQYPAGLLGP